MTGEVTENHRKRYHTDVAASFFSVWDGQPREVPRNAETKLYHCDHVRCSFTTNLLSGPQGHHNTCKAYRLQYGGLQILPVSSFTQPPAEVGPLRRSVRTTPTEGPSGVAAAIHETPPASHEVTTSSREVTPVAGAVSGGDTNGAQTYMELKFSQLQQDNAYLLGIMNNILKFSQQDNAHLLDVMNNILKRVGSLEDGSFGAGAAKRIRSSVEEGVSNVLGSTPLYSNTDREISNMTEQVFSLKAAIEHLSDDLRRRTFEDARIFSTSTPSKY